MDVGHRVDDFRGAHHVTRWRAAERNQCALLVGKRLEVNDILVVRLHLVGAPGHQGCRQVRGLTRGQG